MPMRFPTGVSRDRFNLITAVLAKHARLKVSSTVPACQGAALTLDSKQEAADSAAVHTADCHGAKLHHPFGHELQLHVGAFQGMHKHNTTKQNGCTEPASSCLCACVKSLAEAVLSCTHMYPKQPHTKLTDFVLTSLPWKKPFCAAA